jgi:ABC-type transport system substrate-binding protein
VDQLLQQQAGQIDFQQRQQTLQQASKLIFDRAYFVGLWNDPDRWVAAPRLQNVSLSGITPFYNINEWDITIRHLTSQVFETSRALTWKVLALFCCLRLVNFDL